MSVLGRLFGRRGGVAADDPEEPLEAAEPENAGGDEGRDERREGNDAAYTPEGEHARLLTRVRREAEADAVRHAEDMLHRQFQVASEAESTAASRLADLRVAFLARDTELSERRVTCERQIESRTARQAAAAAALVAAGVPADQVEVGPLYSNRLANWKLAAVLAAGAGIGYLLAVTDLGTVGIACAVVLALVVALWLYTAGPEEIEERALTVLRERHAEHSATLTALNSEVARIEIERDALRGETRGVAEGEVAFAGRLAAAYANAAFSAMPAGSLEGGREFAEQRQPSVELPDWVLALEQVVA
ncbi:MAG TPA: hypothetical protein VGO66_12840 [Solirubrobacterales bacterium]|jgi:hypothetical protein|nr:hypothetical protein [Solirubrobacterales bacterium]